ncbi:MAG: hypothetical protein RJA99_4344 [Pseudomonadota bacterium]|jgi:MFS family permease
MDTRWRALWVLSAARVAMGYQFQAVGSTAPLLREHYGLALADLGWLVGLYLLPGVVLALPGGMLSARFGDRRIAIAGMAAMAAGGALCAVADSLAVLQAGRLLGGVGGVLFNVTGTKMVADWFVGREIDTAMAIYVGTWPLGIGLGLLTLAPIAATASPAAAFGATAVLAALSGVLVAALYQPAPGAAAAGRPRLSSLAAGDVPRLAIAAAGWTAYNVAFALLVAFLPVLFVARGLTIAEAGAFVAPLTATMMISIPFFGWVVGRSGRPLAVSITGLAAWAGCLLALRAGGDPLAWLMIAGFVSGSAAGVMVAAPARFLAPSARAIGLGLFYTLYYAGMAVLPRAAGAIADRLGSPEAILPIAVALIATAAVALVATRLAPPAAQVAPTPPAR